MMPQVAPSILSADFANLERDIRAVEKAGAQIIHVDVMDGHFVPNLTIGMPVVKAIRRVTDLTLDVHLMISNPEERATSFVEAGADAVTVHFEASTHLDQILSEIKKGGAKAGVALNPHTALPVLEEILPSCDQVLVMSVNPGFGGQKIIPSSFDKTSRLKQMAGRLGLDLRIAIDGGIGIHNAADAVRAGVDILVAGSAIFGADDPSAVFTAIQNEASKAARDTRSYV
jgi:ribulose-phosphate 3-epimerase